MAHKTYHRFLESSDSDLVKTEGDTSYPADAYLYVGDEKEPESWQLRVKESKDGALVTSRALLDEALKEAFKNNSVLMTVDQRLACGKRLLAEYQALKVQESDLPGELSGPFKSLQEAVSLSDKQSRVRYAFEKMRADTMGEECYEYYSMEIFEGFLTCRKKGRTYRASWQEENGEIQFGEMEEVEVEFKPVSGSPTTPVTESGDTPEDLPSGTVPFHECPYEEYKQGHQPVAVGGFVEALTEKGVEAPKGSKWDVTIIRAGRTVERRFASGARWVRDYPQDVLEAAIPLFENAPVFAFSGQEHANSPGAKGPREDRVGVIRDVYMEGGDMRGTLVLVDDATWLQTRLIGLQRESLLETHGLSIDAGGEGKWTQELGLAVYRVSAIKEVSSVDVVNSPAAGGAFNRLVASQEEDMTLEQILQMIRDMRPDLLESVDTKTVTMDKAQEILKEALKSDPAKDDPPANAPTQESANNDDDPNRPLTLQEATQLREQIRIGECNTLLESRLSESKLPKPIQAKLRSQFKDKVFEEKALTEAIKLEGDTLDQIVKDLPRAYGGVQVTDDEKDKSAKMLEAMLWGSQGKGHPNYPDYLKDVTPFRSIKEAFRVISGDHQAEAEDIFYESQYAVPVEKPLRSSRLHEAWQRQLESLSVSSWPQALGDSIRRRMIAEYSLDELNEWRKIVSEVSSASDFRTNRRVRTGGYGTLPTVGEQGTYDNLTSPTDEEETFAVTKKGGLEDYTFEMMKNDDVGALRRIPRALARAAQETLYRGVFDILEDNAAMADSVALIAAGHNNLISGALAPDTLTEGRRLLRNQTAYNNSSEFLRNVPRYLVHPTELWDLAHQLTDRRPYNTTGQGEADSQNRNMNVHNTYGLKPIEVDYFAVATDYWLVGDPARVPTIEASFLDGREEPELFVQDMPNIGSMFNADKITWKIRHIWQTLALDYRGFAAYIA